MAVGKNKRLTKSKKGGKKKIIDPFTRKDWYDVKVPSMFSQRIAGKTLINRTQGTHIASEGLKGLVFECNLADLNKNEEQSFRKLKFICEDVQNNTCVTNFHGMDMTRDKLCSLVKKWKTLIEAFVDVKTLDGYLVRLFVIGFTKKRQNQIKKTCYAQSSQVRQIRKKMVEVMTEEATKCDLKGLFAKLIPEHIGKQIERSTKLIFPLENVFVRKVKILKKPKFDLTKLMELHGDNAGKEDQGTKVDREEPAMVESMPGAGGRL